MDYDVLILGGGIIGCAIAYELSKYNINIALIEKDYDIANNISFANTAIIYDGSETDNKEMAYLEREGKELIKNHCKKFNVFYKKVGLLRTISNEAKLNVNILDQMNKMAEENGISGVSVIDGDRIYDIEPNLSIKIKRALYSENTAIIEPYNLAVSYAEIATDNGVNFKLEEEVLDIQNISKGFKVTTNKNKFTCKFVINTIETKIFDENYVESYEKPEQQKVKYILLNEKLENNISNIIINDIDKDTFIINMPTQSNGNLLAIKSNENLILENELMLCKNTLGCIDKELITSIYTEVYSKNNVVIDYCNVENGYIKINGNHNYSQITIAPAIAKNIKEKLKINMNITKKRDYIDKKRDTYIFRNMSNEERNKIIALDNRYGNIICNCNNISEGEIVDSIRRPLGARTIEGVKRRTGIGIGNCNGSYCNMKIIKILAREMNKSVLNIVDDSMDSNILVGRIKEFNEI